MEDQTDRKLVFLSNGITCALENEGSIIWFPAPRFDSPSLFSKILDENKGGCFSIAPESKYSLRTSYIVDTLVAENVYTTSDGKLKVTDFMPLGISGIMRVYESRVPFLADIKPMFNYGMTNTKAKYVEDHGFYFESTNSAEGLEVSIDGRYRLLDNGTLHFQPGKGYMFAMYSSDLSNGIFRNKNFVFPQPYDALEKTTKYWKEQVMIGNKVSAKFKGIYTSSILVSLGLMYLPSGAIIAAPTTSLPEIVGESRNWDYRYLWIRDASYAVEALVNIGHAAKARRILDFMMSLIDPSSKGFDHPLYAIDGTAPPKEQSLNWLSGNKNSKPVRIGNAAYMQVQTDTEGAFMAALYAYLRKTNDKSYISDNWLFIESACSWIKRSWSLASTNIWEERDEPKHFVHTKVTQWVAVDRAAKMAVIIGHKKEAREWSELAAEIKSDVMSNGFSKELNSFVQYYGSNKVDAALLTLPLYGFIDVKDPLFLGTLKRLEKDLVVEGGLMLRYKSDFMGNAAHPFTLPTTWLARVYLRLGERRKAEKIIDNLTKASTDLFLLSE
ncbi:MAG: glycoside hydrolase family 15 protein, partial [Candidatus Micrarchaeota archaeon]|nr:glycoside hydrolase family 15 protein [Candidatus Micrarchaeota archaeon]